MKPTPAGKRRWRQEQRCKPTPTSSKVCTTGETRACIGPGACKGGRLARLTARASVPATAVRWRLPRLPPSRAVDTADRNQRTDHRTMSERRAALAQSSRLLWSGEKRTSLLVSIGWLIPQKWSANKWLA